VAQRQQQAPVEVVDLAFDDLVRELDEGPGRQRDEGDQQQRREQRPLPQAPAQAGQRPGRQDIVRFGQAGGRGHGGGGSARGRPRS